METTRSMLSSLKVLKQVTVEPVLVLYLFSNYLVMSLNVPMLMERICTIDKGLSEEVCSTSIFHNDSLKQLKIDTQKVANNMLLINNFVLTTPGILLAMLTGPWSDKYGRKAPIIIPLIGGLINYILLALMAYMKDLPPHFFIYATIPNGILGGFIHMMSLVSYIADVTPKEDRTVKFVFIEGGYFMAMPIGQLMGGYIYHRAGLFTAYVIASCSAFFAAFYTIFFVKETRGLDYNLTLKEYVREFLRLRNIKECASVMFKKRELNGRRNLILLLLAFSVLTFYLVIQGSPLFMYSQVMFNWGEYDYSVFQSVTNFVTLASNAFVGPLLSAVLKISDMMIGTSSTISAIVSLIIMSLASKPWLFYAGSLSGAFGYMAAPICRSVMSKIVQPDELAKMFAFVSSVESFTPALATVIDSQLYNATVAYFPSAALFFSGLVLLVNLSIFTYIEIKSLGNKNKEYTRIEGLC